MNRGKLLFCIGVNLLLTSMVIGILYIRPAKADSQPYLKWVASIGRPRLLDSPQQGRLNLDLDICKLMNDGSSEFDWYYYSNIPGGAPGIRIETVPGIVCYGSNWETAQTDATFVIRNATNPQGAPQRFLADHSPVNKNGFESSSMTVSVTIGTSGVGFTYSQNWEYEVAWINEQDKSDSGVPKAYWVHDFNEQNDPHPNGPSALTYVSRPGFVVRVEENQQSQVDATLKVDWGHPVFSWWSYDHNQTTLSMDAQLSGDVQTKITIQSQRTTDTYWRSHGKALDRDLPNEWWQQQGYEFTISYQPVTNEQIIYLTYGNHYVEYAASGYVPNYAWHAKIYINDVLKIEGDVGRYDHLRANFAV